MIIEIQDDFDLKKIMISGQCFRVSELSDGAFRFINRESILDIKKIGEFSYETSDNDWDKWEDYFDLSRNYSEIRKIAGLKNEIIKRACDFSKGIRILKQEPWEMLITFILSQRRSLSAIRTSVENLCNVYGHNIAEDIKSFPNPRELSEAGIEDFQGLGFGYRAPYVYEAVKEANEGKLDIEELKTYDDEKLHKRLLSIYGVGEKVANCVELFGFGRINKAPIDVWIKRIIDEDFKGKNPFIEFPENAGIIQQYLFFYAKYRKNALV